MLLAGALVEGKTTCICSGADGGGAALDTAAFEELKVRTGQSCGVSALPAINLTRASGVSTGAIMAVAARMGSSRARVWIMG